MARNNKHTLKYDSDGTTTFDIDPTDSQVVDIDFKDVFNAQFIVQGAYETANDGSGIDINVFYGIGPKDNPEMLGFPLPCKLGGVTSSEIIISDNSDSVSTASYTAGGAQTLNHYFSTNDLTLRVPRYFRIKITNNDATNVVTIQIFADT